MALSGVGLHSLVALLDYLLNFGVAEAVVGFDLRITVSLHCLQLLITVISCQGNLSIFLLGYSSDRLLRGPCHIFELGLVVSLKGLNRIMVSVGGKQDSIMVLLRESISPQLMRLKDIL